MDAPEVTGAVHEVERCLRACGARWRRVAAGEWGISGEAGGWALEVGLALRSGFLRVQAPVLEPGRADARELLHRNRRAVLVRFTQTSAGAVWLQAELPVAAVSSAEVDRLLGLLVEQADAVRLAHPWPPP